MDLSVLIETYWNVNTLKDVLIEELRSVLIETYWNVNEGDLVFLKNSFAGINRNILECK